MNLDELNAIGEVARQRVAREGGSIAAMTRAHTRAMVEALRDEFEKQYTGDNWNDRDISNVFNDILGSDAVEKAAGGPTSNDGQSGPTLSTTPAAELSQCEWTQEGWEYRRAGCNGWSTHIYSPKYSPPGNKCPHCKAPIKFKEPSHE